MKKRKREITSQTDSSMGLFDGFPLEILYAIFSHLQFEEIINLRRLSKKFYEVFDSSLIGNQILLPKLRSEIQTYFQCKIPFEKFPRNNEDENINYKNLFLALRNLTNSDMRECRKSLQDLSHQNTPEAEFLRVNLFPITYVDSRDVHSLRSKLIANFKLAEKFYNEFPSFLTAFTLACYFISVAQEYLRTPFALKNSEDQNSLFYKTITQLAKDHYQHETAYPLVKYFQKDFCKFGNFFKDASDKFALLNEHEKTRFLNWFCHLNIYSLLLAIQRYGLQKQIFNLSIYQYEKLQLHKTTWIFDLYKTETIRLIELKEKAVFFHEVLQNQAIRNLMENTEISSNLKRNFLDSITLTEPSGINKEPIFRLHLNIFINLQKKHRHADALRLAFFYYQTYPIFMSWLNDKNCNRLILKTPDNFIAALEQFLRQPNNAYTGANLYDFLSLYHSAMESNDLDLALKSLNFNYAQDKIKELFAEFMTKPENIARSIDLKECITITDSSSNKNANQNSFFALQAKAKNLKRKNAEKTEEESENCLKRLKTENTRS